MKHIVLFSLCALSFLRAQESLTVETVAGNRALWPREVTVNVAHKVPIVIDGKAAGSSQAPTGRVYTVKTIDASGVTVDAAGTPMVFAVTDTDLLQRAEQAKTRLDAQAAATPPPAPMVQSNPSPQVATQSTPAAATNKIAAELAGDLVALDGRKLKKFDATALGNKKYLAIYFSASWCPPCRKFTPGFVSWYKQKKAGNDQFDVIFVSSDRTEDAMEGYMKEDAMEWPAVDFDKIKRSPLKKYGGRGIPRLVVIDGEGNVLSDSYQGENYVGPTKVMYDLDKLLKGS